MFHKEDLVKIQISDVPGRKVALTESDIMISDFVNLTYLLPDFSQQIPSVFCVLLQSLKQLSDMGCPFLCNLIDV